MQSSLPTTLSPREREVLGLIVRGYTQKEIADIFSISSKTVETHKANGMRKLGCERRAELVTHAIAERWPLSDSEPVPAGHTLSLTAADQASHELLARLHVILGCCDLAGTVLTPERAFAIIRRNAREQVQPIETLIESTRTHRQ